MDRPVDRPLVLAHRGARRRAPENTLEAFRRARELGADGVELDVRRTRDGVLVLHHDPGPAGGPVLATVDHAEVGERYPSIPTLAEALDVCRGLLVNVEIKNLPWEPDFDPRERIADDVVALLRARSGDRVLVSSFHLTTVDHLHERAPEVPTAFLFLAGMDLREVADLAADRGHAAVHPDLRALGGPEVGEFVAHARARGLQVNVWTVNEPADMVRLADLGVDGLVTDVPDVALVAFGQTGSTTNSASGT
ncbi:MAG: glycerophosphodiester phosphodiesterase [Actinomycetota bacterium]